MALTTSQYAASLNPRDMWRLEELAGDFLKTAPAEYDATPGADITNRGQSFVCNGINLTIPLAVGLVDYFQSQRPFDDFLYRNNFCFEQMCRPRDSDIENPAVDGNVGRVIISPIHGGFPPDPYLGQPQGFGVGLKVNTKVIQISLYRDFYINGSLGIGINTDSHSITRYYGGPELGYDKLIHIFVVVEENPIGTVRIKLYINGEYAGNLSGIYVETVGIVGGAFLTSGVNFGWFRSWPDYSRRHIGIFEYYHGYPFIGHLDETIWYDYVLTPTQIENRYKSILATLDATPPGPFTYPLGGEIIDLYEEVVLKWGVAVNASGYLVEREVNGVWGTLGTTDTPAFLYYNALHSGEDIRFRVTPMYNDNEFIPESCVNASIVSAIINAEVLSFSIIPPVPNCTLINPTITSESGEQGVLVGGSCSGGGVTPTLTNCP